MTLACIKVRRELALRSKKIAPQGQDGDWGWTQGVKMAKVATINTKERKNVSQWEREKETDEEKRHQLTGFEKVANARRVERIENANQYE